MEFVGLIFFLFIYFYHCVEEASDEDYEEAGSSLPLSSS